MVMKHFGGGGNMEELEGGDMKHMLIYGCGLWFYLFCLTLLI